MTTLSFEIELELGGFVEPYRAATRTDPAEGDDVLDLDISDAGVLTYQGNRQWKRDSFLKGVDLTNPEVRKLLDNLLELVRDQAETAVVESDLSRAA